MEKIEFKIIAISVVAFAILFTLSFFIEKSTVVLSVSVLTLIFPYFVYRSIISNRVKKLDDMFTNLLMDLSSIMETRISLTQAMPAIYERDYGPLTKFVKRLHIETSWNVPFFDAFMKMGRDTKSGLIKKSINVVMGTFVSGGDLKRIFTAIGSHTKEIMKIKQTVKGRVNIISITCYMIFGCLIISMYIIKSNFLSAFAGFGTISRSLVEEFNTLSFHLIILQSAFAGLITGQIAEDSIFAGVKHSLILVSISIIAYSFFS